MRTGQLAGEIAPETLLHPGHRVDGDGLGAVPLRPPGPQGVPVGAAARLMRDQIVARGQHPPTLLAFVHHGRAPTEQLLRAQRVKIGHRVCHFFRENLRFPDLFTHNVQFIHFVAQKVIFQLASHRLPQSQLGHKSGIGIHHAPLSLEEGQRLVHAQSVLGHQEGGDQGGGAGLAVVAVDQHHALPLARLDEGERPGEVRQKILARNITDLASKQSVYSKLE